MTVEFTVENHVATVCLNRPDKLNALTPEMLDHLLDYFDRAAADAEIRSVLLTGAGRAFCAGADVSGSGSAPAKMSVSYARGSMHKWQQIALKIYNLDKPVVSAVHGAVVGIAWSFALCADILIASESAKFIPAFLMRATLPEAGMVHLLGKLCGEYRAKEIIYLNRRLSGAEAAEIGLATRVVPDDRLMEEARSVAQQLASMPTFSIGLTKQLFRANAGSMEEYLALELNSVALAVNSEDALEGRTAFKENRAPNFKGR